MSSNSGSIPWPPGLEQGLQGRYRLLDLIGRGGMASVYLAEDLRHSRQVALKAFVPDLSQSVGTDRFTREIELMAGLTHPNILPLLDSGEANGTLFYVMPYVEGESLEDRLNHELQLPLEDTVRIAEQVAEALDHAHRQGVVHRDVKPANILLVDGQAIVADFGIAKALSEAGGERLTQTGLVVGTPLYMSPEQAHGTTTVDGRADLYALGCVAYEMLAGEPPFTGANAMAILARHSIDPVSPPSTVRPALPKAVDRVVQKALAKSPADRFRTTGEFSAAFRRAAQENAGTDSRRAPWSRAAVIAVVAIALVGTFWWGSAGTEAARPRRVAVLPVDLSAAPEAAYLAGGVHTGLIGALGQRGVTVVGRASVRRYADGSVATPEIADQLGVDAVLESAVVPTPEGLSVQALLLDGESGTVLWARDFPTPAEGLISTVGAVAASLAEEFELGAGDAGAHPRVPEAARAPLSRGYDLLATLTPAGLDSALVLFERTLEVDPEIAQAHAGVASVWGYRQQMGLAPPYVAGPEAVSSMREAMRLDSLDARTQSIRAILAAWTEWDWEEAEEGFVRALEMDPGDARTRAFYAHYLAIVGREEESRAQIDSALAMDPYDLLIQGLRAADLMLLDAEDEAIAQARATLEVFPGHPLASIALRTIHDARGEFEDAFGAARAETAARGDTALVAALDAGWNEGGYHAAMGRAAEVMEARGETLAYLAPSQVYELYFAAGRVDEGLEWVERGFERRDPQIPYLSVMPFLDPYRDDPRVQALIRRMDYPPA